MRTEKRRSYLKELLELSARFESELDREAIASLLDEVAREYTLDQSGPNVSIARREGVALRLVYPTALSLERALPEWLEMSCIFLQIDSPIAVMTEVTMEILGDGAERSVHLNGRVVQQTPAGVAIEVYRPTENQRLQLLRLPDKMRAGPRATTTTPHPALSSPAPSSVSVPEPVAEPVAEPAPNRPARPMRSSFFTPLPAGAQKTWPIGAEGLRPILREVIALGPSAILAITTGATSWQVVLRRGEVTTIDREPWSEADSLEGLLLEAGRLTPEDLLALRRVMERDDSKSEEALIKLDLLTPQALRVAARTRLRFLLKRLLSIDDGVVAMHDASLVQPPLIPVQISLVQYLFDEAYESYCETSLNALKGGRVETLQGVELRFAPLPGIDTSFLSDDDKRHRLLALLEDEHRALYDIQRASPLSEHQTLAFLLALDALGWLSRKRIVTRTWVQSQRLEHIAMLAANLGRENYFERLGVHWSAYEEEIHKAYEATTAKLDLDGLPSDDVATLEDKIGGLRAQIDEAYDVLKSRPSRVAYRRTIADDFACASAIETFLKHVETAKLRRDIPMALEYCQRILELQPAHPSIRQDYELLRSLQAPPA